MASASSQTHGLQLLAQLPAPKQTSKPAYDFSNDPWFRDRYIEKVKPSPSPAPALAHKINKKAQTLIPHFGVSDRRNALDFGDGGAFSKIHIRQNHLGMELNHPDSAKHNSKTLSVAFNESGNLAFASIVKQRENASKIIYSKHSDLIPKLPETEPEINKDEEEKEIEETTQRTKAALEKIVSSRLRVLQPKNVEKQSMEASYIKYTPSQKNDSFNSGAKERLIRMVEMPKDPLELPKFKHKKIPSASGSPPVPVMHSPQRGITFKDQKDWKIPPCISNWKNQKGYTIPLDKRLAADGRGLQNVQVNDHFAKVSEALYVAEKKAREAVEMRSKIHREMILKEKEKKQQDLRMLAQKARNEWANCCVGGGVASNVASETVTQRSCRPDVASELSSICKTYSEASSSSVIRESKEEREERLKREALREERKRERERERRLEAKEGHGRKKSKITRDRDRDVSEKVALGMANLGTAESGEVMYDQRLFNQEQGLQSGFATDDAYNVYDKALFNSYSALSSLYRPKKDGDSEMYGGADEQMDKILNTRRFRANKGFAGANERGGPRDRPVEFEKDQDESDPFGLDQFLIEVKKGKKALDRVGTSDTMAACGG